MQRSSPASISLYLDNEVLRNPFQAILPPLVGIKKMSIKQRIYDKWNDFELEFDFSKRLNLQIDILAIFNAIPKSQLDFEDYYIIGLSYYNLELDGNDNDYLNIAISNFIKSLRLKPDYNMSRLYLAHCYHDCNDFKNALENYLKVDQVELKNDFAIWRLVKLIEQIGYCCYLTGDKNKGIDHFKKVLDYYRNLDLADLANPSELLSCLPDDNDIKIEIKKIINAH